MNSERCKGCLNFKRNECRLLSGLGLKINDIVICLCSKCIIKSMCNNYCEKLIDLFTEYTLDRIEREKVMNEDDSEQEIIEDVKQFFKTSSRKYINYTLKSRTKK